MKTILMTFILLFFISCGQLPTDQNQSPMDANFYTVELNACGKKGLGLLACSYRNQPKEATLSIPVTHSGSFTIRSNRCGFNRTERFSGDQNIEIKFDELLSYKNNDPECLYEIKIFIDDFERGFQGIFRLFNLEEFEPAKLKFRNKEYEGVASFQFREGLNPSLPLKFIARTPGTLVLNGCDKIMEFPYESNPELLLADIMDDRIKTCGFTIGLLPNNPNLPTEIFSLMISRFKKESLPLLFPAITHKRNKMTIEVEGSVAVIQAGNERKVFNCGTFRSCSANKTRTIKIKYEENKTYWIRYYTKIGRAMTIAYRNKEFIWKPDTILY